MQGVWEAPRRAKALGRQQVSGGKERAQGGEALSLTAVWPQAARFLSLGLSLLHSSIREAKCNDL